MPPVDNSFGLIMLVGALSLLPLAAVTITAFAKIAIVVFIVRNALGIQQLPPNIIVYAMSLILSVYIALPTVSEAYDGVRNAGLTYHTFDDWEEAAGRAAIPLKAFLKKHTDDTQLAFFVQSTDRLWNRAQTSEAAADNLAVLVPSFLLSEMTRAFEIGFLLYLPFMAIDIIVTTLLMALGMMMIPPSTISIPFKLMLFVFVDGWTKIVQGLVLSYV